MLYNTVVVDGVMARLDVLYTRIRVQKIRILCSEFFKKSLHTHFYSIYIVSNACFEVVVLVLMSLLLPFTTIIILFVWLVIWFKFRFFILL